MFIVFRPVLVVPHDPASCYCISARFPRGVGRTGGCLGGVCALIVVLKLVGIGLLCFHMISAWLEVSLALVVLWEATGRAWGLDEAESCCMEVKNKTRIHKHCGKIMQGVSIVSR